MNPTRVGNWNAWKTGTYFFELGKARSLKSIGELVVFLAKIARVFH